MRIVLGVMLVYSAFILLTLGLFFDRFSVELWPEQTPVEIVNQSLLAAFISLFFIRFLFQKTPRMKIVPYLHLPVRRRDLETSEKTLEELNSWFSEEGPSSAT